MITLHVGHPTLTVSARLRSLEFVRGIPFVPERWSKKPPKEQIQNHTKN
jgi:hypothetical protein